MIEASQPSIKSAFKWLFLTMGRRGASAVGVAMLFIMMTGYLANLPALLLGEIVDTLSNGTDQDIADATIQHLLMLIVFSLIGVELFTLVRKYLIERASVAVQKTAFMSQVRQLFALRVTAMNSMRTGGLAIHLDRGVEGLVILLKVTFMELVPSIASAGVAIYFAFSAHVLAGLVMIVVVCIGAALTVWQVKSQQGIRMSLETSKGKIGGIVAEMMSALAYIRASGLSPMETERLDDAAQQLKKTEMRHHVFMMAFDACKKLTENAGLVAVILSGLYLFRANELHAGGILTLVLLYRNAALPLEKMHKVIDEGHEAIIRIGMLNEIRNQPRDPGLLGTQIPETPFSTPLVNFTNYRLQLGDLKNVSPPALLDIDNLSITQGEIVGIAGESGSGKSTFIQAVLGLFPDATGTSEFQGCPFLDISKPWLASQIAYMPQRPFIIAGNLRENVMLSLSPAQRSALSDDTIYTALERAGVAQTPSDRLMDLNLQISEGGRNLSDGQCQRIGLARIFLSDAKLIILDEATSALDTLSEEIVIQNLSVHAVRKTVLMIAHRLSTLAWASRILVFEQGNIIQDGSYDTLSQVDGKFYDLRSLGNNDLAPIAAE